MSAEVITQLGVGGIFAILILKIVFDFVSQHKNKTKHKEDCVTRNEFNKHKGAVQYRNNCEQIVKRIDAAFDAQRQRFDKVDADIGEVKQLIRDRHA